MLKEKAKRGRPIATKTLVTQMMRERMAMKIAEKLDPVLDALIESALGTTITKIDKEGKPRKVKLPPDVNAARILFEYSLSKPKERIQPQVSRSILSLVAELNQDS